MISHLSAKDASATEVEAAVAFVDVGVCGDDSVDVVFAQLDGRSLSIGRRSGDSNGRKGERGDGEELHDGFRKAAKAFRSVQLTPVKSLSSRMYLGHMRLQLYQEAC